MKIIRVSARFLLAFAFLCEVPAGVRTLTLNGLEIGLDETTGGITSLAYANVGRILQADPASASIVDLAFPLIDYVPMRLGTRFSRAEFSEIEGGIIIRWREVKPSRTHVPLPPGSAEAEVRLTAAPDGRSVILTCRIENKFSQPIPQVLFPDFVGLRAVGTPEETKLTMARGAVTPFTQRGQSRHHGAFWPVDGGWRIYESTAYSYGPNVMNWYDYGSLKGGFSLFQKKWRDQDYRRPDFLTQVTEAQPDSLRLTCWQPGRIAPGETWNSPECWLTPHEGGWAKGIDVYRKFIEGVNPTHEIPRHVREGLGFLSIWMSDGHETVPERAAIRYKDVPDIARDVKAHGLDEMSLWRWCSHLRMPIPHRRVLGTVEEWVQAVREARALGVNTSGALGIHLLHHTQLPRYGVNYTTRNAWNFHRDLIPYFNPIYLKGLPLDHAGQTVPPSNKLWQEDVVSSISEWIDRGVTSFTWDVYGGGGPDGALTSRYEDNVALIDVTKRFRAYARKKDPQSTFNAETNSISGLEWEGEVLDYTWNWITDQVKEGHLTTTTYIEYVEAAPISNLLRAPRMNSNIEGSPLAMKKCMADGLYINFLLRKPDGENGSAILSEKPALSPAVKQAAARRKQFLPFFTDGTPIGDCILSTPSPLFVRSHVIGNKALLILLNDGNAPLKTNASLNAGLWLAEGPYRINRYDQDGKLVAKEEVAVRKRQSVTLNARMLKPEEMEFLVIEPKT